MKNTACENNCPFVKNGLCQTCRECPNFIETWWVPGDDSQPVKLEDCAPKRLVLQQQLLQARFDIVMTALVESRNENAKLNGTLKSFIEMGQAIINENIILKEKQNEKFILSCDNSNESDTF